MAFFDLLEAPLACENGFFGYSGSNQGLTPAVPLQGSCLNRFYADVRKGIFLARKPVKRFFNLFLKGEVVTKD